MGINHHFSKTYPIQMPPKAPESDRPIFCLTRKGRKGRPDPAYRQRQALPRRVKPARSVRAGPSEWRTRPEDRKIFRS